MHRILPTKALVALLTIASLGLPLRADLELLFEERSKAVVMVSFTVVRETDRQQEDAVGIVVDERGLIAVHGNTVPGWLPFDQILDPRVHLPDTHGDGYDAEFLGEDPIDGWYFLRAGEGAWGELTPVTAFATRRPRIGEELWGICMTDALFDYMPYFRSGRLSAIHPLPLEMGFTGAEVASPGALVFGLDGALVGWSQPSNAEERQMWLGNEAYPIQLVNPNESYTFLLAEGLVDGLAARGEAAKDVVVPWLGISGIQSLDRDTAEFLGLEDQGAVIVSQVLDGSPAHQAGFQDRDIIVGLGGERLPRFRPDSVMVAYLERQIRLGPVGAKLSFAAIRGNEELVLEAELVAAPKREREAERHYLEALGFTVRETVMSDALVRRVSFDEMGGVIVSFVRPNSPPSTEGLMPGDWILEIDGQELDGFDHALEVLAGIQVQADAGEYVLLIRRENETAVLRVQRD